MYQQQSWQPATASYGRTALDYSDLYQRVISCWRVCSERMHFSPWREQLAAVSACQGSRAGCPSAGYTRLSQPGYTAAVSISLDSAVCQLPVCQCTHPSDTQLSHPCGRLSAITRPCDALRVQLCACSAVMVTGCAQTFGGKWDLLVFPGFLPKHLRHVIPEGLTMLHSYQFPEVIQHKTLAPARLSAWF